MKQVVRRVLGVVATIAAAASLVAGLVAGLSTVSAAASPAAFTLVGGTPVVTATGGNGADASVFSPNGDLLVTADQDLGQVSVYSVSITGALSLAPGSPVAEGSDTGPSGVAFSPNGQLLAVANSADNGSVAVYTVATDGSMTAVPGSPFPSGSGTEAVAFNPGGTLLAAGNAGGNGSVSMFAVAPNGVLNPVAGSPVGLGMPGFFGSVSFSPSGQLLAAGVDENGNAVMFSVAANGALAQVPGSPFQIANGNPFSSLAFSSNGLLAATTWNTVAVYAVSGAGILTAAPGSPLTVQGSAPGSTPVLGDIAWNRTGSLLSATSNLGLLVYSVSAQGVLAAAPGSPLAVGLPTGSNVSQPNDVGFSAHGLLATGNTDCPTAPDGGIGCDIDSVSMFAPRPTTAITSPATGLSFPYGSNVPTAFSCPDPYGAGIQSCTDSNGASAPSGSLNTGSIGSFTYSVTAHGSDGQSSSSQITYSVTKAPTTLVATPEGLLFTSLSATLKGATGNPLAGALVTFSTDGLPIGTATTNSNGVATYDGLGLAIGPTYTAHYAGNADYLASSGSAAL
jgi:WD40 repeat protein